MTTDKEPPTIVKDMNIFCPEGRLQLPPYIAIGPDKTIVELEPELDTESDSTPEIIDEEAQAWETVDFIKKSLRKIQDEKGIG